MRVVMNQPLTTPPPCHRIERLTASSTRSGTAAREISAGYRKLAGILFAMWRDGASYQSKRSAEVVEHG